MSYVMLFGKNREIKQLTAVKLFDMALIQIQSEFMRYLYCFCNTPTHLNCQFFGLREDLKLAVLKFLSYCLQYLNFAKVKEVCEYVVRRI